MQNQGTQSDEYILDDYDEGPTPVPNVPPTKLPNSQSPKPAVEALVLLRAVEPLDRQATVEGHTSEP